MENRSKWGSENDECFTRNEGPIYDDGDRHPKKKKEVITKGTGDGGEEGYVVDIG